MWWINVCSIQTLKVTAAFILHFLSFLMLFKRGNPFYNMNTLLNAQCCHHKRLWQLLCFKQGFWAFLHEKERVPLLCSAISGATEIITVLSTQINIQHIQTHLCFLSNGVLWSVLYQSTKCAKIRQGTWSESGFITKSKQLLITTLGNALYIISWRYYRL